MTESRRAGARAVLSAIGEESRRALEAHLRRPPAVRPGVPCCCMRCERVAIRADSMPLENAISLTVEEG